MEMGFRHVDFPGTNISMQLDCCHFLAHIWVFPKIVVPQNGWFIVENPIKMDDLGVPLFSETSPYLKDCTKKTCNDHSQTQHDDSDTQQTELETEKSGRNLSSDHNTFERSKWA